MDEQEHTGGGNKRGTRQTFGSIRELPSGRFQARYTGPDGVEHKAPLTFDTSGDAQMWLATVRTDLVRDAWNPVAYKAKAPTFGPYAEGWLRARSLEARTRDHYRKLLDQHLLPTFRDVQLRRITPDAVRLWHSSTLLDRPTYRAHAYSLLRTILGQAVGDQIISANPCTIRGAGSAKRVHKIRPASLEELEQIVTALPDRYRVMALLAAWCGLRFGELAELRRSDVDVKNGLLRVRRGVIRAAGETVVKKPKSDAGVRNVAVPPHLMPMLRDHLLQHTEEGKDGLLFPARQGGHMQPSSLYTVWYPARKAAGREDLRWHDLRHTGAVMAAQTGATLAELMARLGHSTPGAAMRYQHAADGRDVEIAKALSKMAGR